jgi:hypothetical protein
MLRTMGAMSVEQHFSLEKRDDYIHLRTWGSLDESHLDVPAEAALKLAEDEQIELLLDDIRDVDTSGVSIPIQAKGMGVLWKLRKFKKVAIVLGDNPLKHIFFSTVEALHVTQGTQFKGFENEVEAIEWLHSS